MRPFAKDALFEHEAPFDEPDGRVTVERPERRRPPQRIGKAEEVLLDDLYLVVVAGVVDETPMVVVRPDLQEQAESPATFVVHLRGTSTRHGCMNRNRLSSTGDFVSCGRPEGTTTCKGPHHARGMGA